MGEAEEESVMNGLRTRGGGPTVIPGRQAFQADSHRPGIIYKPENISNKNRPESRAMNQIF
jgi:hypothetical protein